MGFYLASTLHVIENASRVVLVVIVVAETHLMVIVSYFVFTLVFFYVVFGISTTNHFGIISSLTKHSSFKDYYSSILQLHLRGLLLLHISIILLL